MRVWQTMESAPKDRTIQLWGIYPGRATPGNWDNDSGARKPKPYWTSFEVERLYGVRHARAYQPSHWMDMPEGPSL